VGLETKNIFKICLLTPPSAAGERVRQPALQQEQQESGSNEVGISLFVDEDRVPWVFPHRKFVRKPCTRACACPPVSSLTFGRDFTPADVASKSRRPKSRGRCPRNLGDRTFGEPFWSEPVIAQGQGRVDCRGHLPGEQPNPRLHPQGQEDRGRVCPLSRCTPSSPVLRFPCIRPYMMRGIEEGSCFLESAPSRKKQETRSSPSS
jgi:hypothetical protein